MAEQSGRETVEHDIAGSKAEKPKREHRRSAFPVPTCRHKNKKQDCNNDVQDLRFASQAHKHHSFIPKKRKKEVTMNFSCGKYAGECGNFCKTCGRSANKHIKH
ncbi:MAG: hypothetical protein ACLVKO_09080 [Dysgonomonas sp.]